MAGWIGFLIGLATGIGAMAVIMLDRTVRMNVKADIIQDIANDECDRADRAELRIARALEALQAPTDEQQ